MEKVKKQYGLWTGIAMVVGIVIGSGVFFKADDILISCAGDLKLSLLAWLVGGLIMVASGFCFAVFATRITKYNGLIDYVETTTNKKVGYGLAWMMTTIYYPIIGSIVAIVASEYFLTLFMDGETMADTISWLKIVVAFVLVVSIVLLNYFSPIISAKLQVSATVIKLIPIIVIAVVGLFAGAIWGDGFGIIDALTNKANLVDQNGNIIDNPVPDFGGAIKATAFAYEGWICATAINAELKDSKKNLPRALVFGTIAILLFYVIYYLSLSACIGNQNIIDAKDQAPIIAFKKVLGQFGGLIFQVFVVVSCVGTVNGLAISCCRGMYTMSCRGQGICPEKFSKLGKNQSVSFLSCLYGLGCIVLFLGIWALIFNNRKIFAYDNNFLSYLGAMDGVICAIIYAVYITLYIHIIRKFNDCNVFARYIMPVLAIIGSLFFVICGTGLFELIASGSYSGLISFAAFMLLFVVLMTPCLFFYKEKNNILLE